MKKVNLIILALILLVSSNIFAQSNKFNYQAALRDASGEIMVNENVEIEFSILLGSVGSPAGYTETHNTSTNDYGLVNLLIGDGTATLGVFDDIEWLNGDYFLNVKVDGIDMGTSEFHSVPFSRMSYGAAIAFKGNNKFSVDSMLVVKSDSEYNFIKTDSDGKLHFITESEIDDPTMTMDISGQKRVGIGTENPTEKLEVNGAIKVTEETSTPAPNTFYGNSGPLAYGLISTTSTLTNFGITSVTTPSVGSYIITLNNNWVGAPVVLVTSYNGSSTTEIATYSTTGTNQITVRIVDENNTPTASNFSILVYGFAQ